MKIIPKSHFVVAHRYDMAQDIIEVPNQDDEGKWVTIKVDSVGGAVDGSYIFVGMIGMVKYSDINFITFNGEEYLYIDEEFIVRVEP